MYLRSSGRRGGALLLALSLASAGCSTAPSATVETAGTPVQPAEAASTPASPPWWRASGDPVLAALVQQGLDVSPEVACRIASLRQYDVQSQQDAHRLGARLGRLLGDRSMVPDPRIRDDKVQRIAQRRDRVATDVARAYVEVRRLQQHFAVRSAMRDQYHDNADIARFRREAGLVPAMDGSLARSQDEGAQGELSFTQARLDHAIERLARLTGDTTEALKAKLGTPGGLPEPMADPVTAGPVDDPARARAADATLREARLTQALDDARRTVRDARTAYREGAGSFSTLYVAEAAALDVELALIDARALRVLAGFDVLAERDASWTREDLAPTVASDPSASGTTITVNAACD